MNNFYLGKDNNPGNSSYRQSDFTAPISSANFVMACSTEVLKDR